MTTVDFKQKLTSLQANMFNFAYMLTSDREDAADLMQDTMLKVLDNADKDTGNSKFKGGVFAIMRH
ncbi:MAG: RNA polymerase sigma factor, partial [Paramuribaculum sp.]|nr:RNA polymerase sigma factor [Paramuribaculum sp.]